MAKNNSYQIEGTLHRIFDTKDISDKFRKREFILEITRAYKEDEVKVEVIKFQVVNDKCDVLNDYKVGDTAKVYFSLSGRSWDKDGKTLWFTNLDCWRIMNMSEADKGTSDGNVPNESDNSSQAASDSLEGDLPF